MRTTAQMTGDEAEALVADRLASDGWLVVGRQVRVGHAELDIVAIDPGPPRELVVVEVRARRRRDFGLPEETVDRAKQSRLRHAAFRWLDETRPALARLPLRFDLVVVEPGQGRSDGVRVRHHRSAF